MKSVLVDGAASIDPRSIREFPDQPVEGQVSGNCGGDFDPEVHLLRSIAALLAHDALLQFRWRKIL